MTDTILPHALPGALQGRDGIKILSLDCFDTLLWRDSQAPHDLFGALPAVTVPQRRRAEMRARLAAELRRRRNEVTIDEIYRELLPSADAATRAAAIQHELDAEAAHCYAFRPAVELMREAKRTGRKIIIVSDTYLDAGQLRTLIARAAGDDVAALIDTVFCSSAFGRAKAQGLYGEVLKKLNVAPHEILHIGDNANADVAGVAPFGVATLHLVQFTDATEQRLRMEAAVNTILHPASAGVIATHQPHRPVLAANEPQIDDAAEAFGFGVLGPVFHAFERWLTDEAAAIEAARGGRVHWLFLMRDGRLPMMVHAASGHAAPGHAVEISRFTATAASFVDEEAVLHYLQYETRTDPRVMASQLLIPPAEAAEMLKAIPAGLAGETLVRAAAREMCEPARVRRVVKASAAFAERLVAHVRAACDPQPGDTLMLIDLGYNGTVQNEVDALLRRALKVEVAGRYLLLREHVNTGLDKRGMIDGRHYDAHALEALCGNVAVVEQMCTTDQGSVIDYAADGTPVRRANTIRPRQTAVRAQVQAGVVRFCRAAEASFVRANHPDAAMLWRRGAAAAMARLMFLPAGPELAVLDAFEHDVNLGVDEKVKLFDRDVARQALRQRGLFYMKSSDRMYLPAELDGEGMSAKLSLLTQRRFGLPFKYADFIDRSVALPVIVADGKNATTGTVDATATHDGYFLAPIPIGDCRYSVGLQFGQLYDWLQIDSVAFMSVEAFLSEKHQMDESQRPAAPSLEGMVQVAPHLFQCQDEYAFMMVPPPPRIDDQPMMLAVVFRPIAARQPAAPATTAPAQTHSGVSA